MTSAHCWSELGRIADRLIDNPPDAPAKLFATLREAAACIGATDDPAGNAVLRLLLALGVTFDELMQSELQRDTAVLARARRLADRVENELIHQAKGPSQ
jgi:hypothetical protein